MRFLLGTTLPCLMLGLFSSVVGCGSPPTAIESAVASSTLKNQAHRYASRNVVDRNSGTAWCEGQRDAGVGASLTLTFNKAGPIRELHFRNGFGEVRYWGRNNRIKGLELIAGTQRRTVMLKDTRESQRVQFKPIDAATLTLRIKSVYASKRDNDTCLAEVSLTAVPMLGVEDAFLTLPNAAFVFGKGVPEIDPDRDYPFRHSRGVRRAMLVRGRSANVEIAIRRDYLRMSEQRPPGGSGITRDVRLYRENGALIALVSMSYRFFGNAGESARVYKLNVDRWDKVVDALPAMPLAAFYRGGRPPAILLKKIKEFGATRALNPSVYPVDVSSPFAPIVACPRLGADPLDHFMYTGSAAEQRLEGIRLREFPQLIELVWSARENRFKPGRRFQVKRAPDGTLLKGQRGLLCPLI